MNLNLFLTTSSIVSEFLNFHPYIQRAINGVNLAYNLFPKYLPVGHTQMNSTEKQEKLNRIQTFVNELKDKMGLENTPIQVRISSLLSPDKVSYFGNSFSIGGGVVFLGQELFDKFEDPKILASPLFQEWQELFHNIPDNPKELALFLDSLSPQKRKRILYLAEKFQTTCSQEELKALLSRKFTLIRENASLTYGNFYTYIPGFFKALEVGLILIRGFNINRLPNISYAGELEIFFQTYNRVLSAIFLIPTGFFNMFRLLKNDAEFIDTDNSCALDRDAIKGLIEYLKKTLIIEILKKTTQYSPINNTPNATFLKKYVNPKNFSNTTLLDIMISKWIFSQSLQQRANEGNLKIYLRPVSKISSAVGLYSLFRHWVDFSPISNFAFSVIRNGIIAFNKA